MSEKFKTKTAKLHAWRQILVDRFPECFAPSSSDVEKRPLAIGIDKELFARCPDLPRISIRKALRHYTSRPSYLRAVIVGAERIGLDGQPVELISEREADFALASLAAQREHNSLQKAIEATRRPKVVPAPSPRPELVVEPPRPKLSLPPPHEARRPVVVQVIKRRHIAGRMR